MNGRVSTIAAVPFMLLGAVVQGQEKISVGTAVPVGQLEAVGTIPGCTATLIETDLVLTAAHCVCPTDTSPVGCATRRTFTLHDVFPVDDPGTPVDESLTRQNVSIDGTVRVHLEFGQRGWLREDLAVIELDQHVFEVAHVTPIPVQEPADTPIAGDVLTIVGFGSTGSGCANPPAGKQKLSLPLEGSNFAALHFSSAGLHSCPGDSGGPALDAAGKVVGVASWGDFSTNSTYRPTSFSYNWIFGCPRPERSSCSWVAVSNGGHQAGPDWCSQGEFLVAFDQDGDRSSSGHDAPIIGQALCCDLEGAETNGWDSCAWHQVGNSHQPRPAWCPDGSFVTQFDLDADSQSSAHDSPIVGQVKCCKLAGAQYRKWGSSYWIPVENSHQASGSWCEEGAFLTQFDLDALAAADEHDSPIVGQAKCSRPCLRVKVFDDGFESGGCLAWSAANGVAP